MSTFEIYVPREHANGTFIVGFEWEQVLRTVREMVESVEGQVVQLKSSYNIGRYLMITVDDELEHDLQRDIAQVLKTFGVKT